MAPEKDANSVSGLDLKPTIDFYTANSEELYRRVSVALPAARDSVQLPQMEAEVPQFVDEGAIRRILSLFPDESLGRSILRKILFKNSLWFGKESTAESLQLTGASDEAISETSIIPSSIHYSQNESRTTADIHLYSIPSVVNPEIARIITTQGLVHEIAHCIAARVIWEDGNLQFEDGTITDGSNLMAFFCELTSDLPSMSHYSGSYRNIDSSYPTDINKLIVAISEELAESITAYLLGFTYCDDDPERCLDPFKDRPLVRDLVEKFLKAEEVQ